MIARFAPTKRAAPRSDPPTLTQFVVLSMLLHVLVVLLFGNAAGIGARRVASGVLDVDLRPATAPQGAGVTRAPGADTTSAGRSLLQRLLGGPQPPTQATPSAPATPNAAPAARTPVQPDAPLPSDKSFSSANPTPGTAVPSAEPSAPPITPDNLQRQDIPRADLQRIEVPVAPAPPPDAIAPQKLDYQRVPDAQLRSLEAPPVAVQPAVPIRPQNLQRQRIAPLDARPLDVPSVQTLPLVPLVPEALPRQRIAPLDAKRLDAPIVETVPPVPLVPDNLQRPHIAPLEAKPLEAPPVEMVPAIPLVPEALPRQRVAPLDVRPLEVPDIATTPAVPLVPGDLQRQRVAPLETRPLDVPNVELVPATPLVPDNLQRQRVAPLDATPLATPAEKPAISEPAPESRGAPPEAASTPSTPRRDTGSPTEAAPRLPGTQAPPSGVPPRSRQTGDLPPLRFGTPELDAEVFRPRVVSAPDAEGSSHVNLDAARRRAREIASEESTSRGVLPVFNAPPPAAERKTRLGEGIEKAAKPDCRTAYAGLGLLAIFPLMASTVSDTMNCRW